MRAIHITKQITSRTDASMDKYLLEISKIELLTPEQELELVIKFKNGDDAALEKLVNANLRFVVSVAKKYQGSRIPLCDLINEGNIGLIKAAHRFDETRGFKFISYAVWWIRQSILQAIADQSRVVNLTTTQMGALNALNKAIAVLEQKFEREPTLEELSEELGIPDEHVSKTMATAGKEISLDMPFDAESSHSLLDVLEDNTEQSVDEYFYYESLKKDIQRVLTRLPPNMAIVLNLHFGLEGTRPLLLEDIGEVMGLSSERVRQIKVKALSIIAQEKSLRKLAEHYV